MPKLRALGACCVLIFIGLAPTLGFAQDCDPWVARLLSLQGSVEVKRDDSARWLPASLGQEYCFGDQLRVGAHSRASVELNNDTILRLDQKSTLILPEPSGGDLSFVELLEGALHLISRIRGRLEIRTPFVNAGLEGTEFVVRVHDAETVVAVIEGQVRVSNALGSLQLTDGQTASGTKTAAPVLRLDLKPEDAVQWAIHYPLITDPAAPGLAAGIGEAQRLLQVGRVAEAKAVIDDILQQDPGNSDALALAAIIELAQNRKAAALALAERAVAEGESGAALTALSYAQQAGFELQAARATAARATQQFPDQALLWARLAELQASLGQRAQAVASAKRAAELDPDLSRTQTVLGFAYLVRSLTADARTTFEQAIRMDSADPLPRLGLGLAKIRQGELVDGRREMEIAVSLDPANALVRSYLGKAYFEEDRSPAAAAEFNLARQLDPLDPTPWLYDAIRKQAENRPVEALNDLERSIALNDNRAVFRSRLSLDQDEAARGVNVGRIYTDLGFDRLAATQGWQATALDPTNFSAHELLAHAYTRRSRHEIARASELMQANLLRPLGAFSVRSLTFDSQGLIPEAFGSSSLSLGEYSAMYNQKGLGAQAEIFVGNNDTGGDRIVAFQLADRFSLLGTQYHYENDGFRENNDLTIDVYDLMGQVSLSDGNMLQFEIQREERENGDLDLLFDLGDFSSRNREERETDLLRLGHRIDLNPRTTWLTSLMYSDTDSQERIFEQVGFIPPGIPVTRNSSADFDVAAYLAEFQLISRSTEQNWIAGIGHFTEDTDGQRSTSLTTPLGPLGPPMPPSDEGSQLDHTNGYVYSYHNLQKIQLVMGLSFDSFDFESSDGRIDKSQVNPKLGLIWQPTNALTLRMAYTETLMPSLINDRTLEPTHVAGFNQFFDDIAGTETQRAGFGIDYLLSPGHAAGAEISGRDLDVPFVNGAVEEQEERAFRGYYYRTFGTRWSGRLGVEWDDFERDPPSTEARRPNELETRRLPVEVRYHDPNGLFGNLEAINVRQKVVGLAAAGKATEDFWTINGGVGYRMPKQRGSVELKVRNLFDQEFRYFGEDFQSGRVPDLDFIPERTVEVTLSLTWW